METETIKKQNWRTYYKGDLVYVYGMGKDSMRFIPAFIYESQRQKEIVQVYAFGAFDEPGSSYLKDMFKAEDSDIWMGWCEKMGYKKDYVIEKMKNLIY